MIAKQGIHMWGEVIVELKNETTGEIEKSFRIKNTLMQRFIDYIIGHTGYAPGFNLNNANQDQRCAFVKNIVRGGINPFNDTCYEPDVIVLGSGTTPFTGTEAALTTPIAASDHNTYVSREGGSGQAFGDNIYLKLSTTYLTTEVNGVNINEIGLYNERLYEIVNTFTGRVGNIVSWVSPAPVVASLWKIYSPVWFDQAAPGGNMLIEHTGVPAFQFAYTWNQVTQTLDVFDALPIITAGVDTFDAVGVPGVSNTTQPYIRDLLLAGIVLPETIVKTVNHSLTVIWLIHFDAV
jgi:hypothetical protein